ncbi:hypothetical protein CEV33_1408 [Brucella grignonensis]|uniref:Uncharacterized protein n=1 Tax=Brucella grignonensis TaxID=94627 RepID=A0A256FAF4_9HYPH|nr:hypothetical protein CEV33_1408 [Brucella grignonensis]
MEMAHEMTRAARKDAKNGVVPRLSGLTRQIAKSFQCPEDVVHPSGYFVEMA